MPNPSTRQYWIDVMTRIATPVLSNLSAKTLKKNMPVEAAPNFKRDHVTHLEAIGRLLAGLAPWLALEEPESQKFAEQARQSIDAATDPESPDYCNFGDGQPVVDAAFLVQGILRAPNVLWKPLEKRVQKNVITALRNTRVTKPAQNNWLLFSAMVETGLFVFGAPDWDAMRIDYALQMHETWYKGDGIYGDGANFHWDYYNAFVIQPMMVDILRHVGGQKALGDKLTDKVNERAQRFAVIQERFISPEGTFPPIGRSLAYRFGALQGLAHMALLKRLPESLPPAQVREALTAVIHRQIEQPGTFDTNGWLKVGFCGAQPGIGERYISTGSLYLCSVGLLPLGLPASDPFWTDPPVKWTSARAWAGEDFPIDHAI
jgi:hypothetical protein